MSDQILNGDFTVYYEVENRQKRIVWTGSSGGTRTVNELYSALQDLFDELTQLDDGTPMSAQTPTEYTIGIIDAGDDDPWFIDRTSVEHLTGGALKTSGWKRVTGSNTGIVRVPYSVGGGTDFATSDIGKTVNHTDGDSGTLLDFKSDGSSGVAWIRPADETSSNDWDSTSGTISVSGGTGSVTQSAASDTGESLWANIYSIGTIEDFTHIYVYQDGSYLTKYKDSSADWWVDGHIDILVNVKECDTTTGTNHPLGYLTVFARQYSKTYDHFQTNVASGGRNPIPLATGVDLNAQEGYRKFTGSSGSGTFNIGNYIYVGSNWASATKRGVITAVGGTTSAPEITYYLIGDLTDFSNGDSVKEYTGEADGDATCTAGTPSDVGPANLTGVSISHGSDETFDINEDGTTENYSIVIDCGNQDLADVYQWSQYITRRGGLTTGDTDGIEGEQYIGSDYRVYYTSLTGTISEGDTVTQDTTGAQGVVVAHNTTDKILILRNSYAPFDSSKAFDNSHTIRVDGSNYVTGVTCSAIAPIKAAPFGTFAGGTWFCAPGVVLDNVLASQINSFQLVDDDGNVITAPTKVSVTVGNTRAGDRIAVFRLTSAGGQIKKDEYTIDSGQGSAGSSSIKVDPDIATDIPGKSTGGILFVVDNSNNVEHRYRYTSWSGDTFTLFTYTGLTADGSGCDSETLVDSDASFVSNGVKVGDIIRNVTDGEYAYVVSVDSETQLTTTPISGDWNGDSYEIGTTVQSYTTSDNVYVPLIHVYETTGSDASPGTESVSIVYVSNIPVRIRARHAGDILPYEADSTVTNTGMSNNIIRTPDTIYS